MRHPALATGVVITAFVIAAVSLLPIKVEVMETDPLWIFEITPATFWISIGLIVTVIMLLIPHLNDKRFKIVFIFASVILIICFRMIFPVIFTSIPAYEPDATGYITTVGSWVNHGIDFGEEGDYRHNYPLSFFVGFTFVKLGIPLDTFFRIAPFVMYSIDIVILYLIIREILPDDRKDSPLAVIPVFLFSFSSLGYWVTVHYCPDLFGSLMFFISLYLVIRFVKAGEWRVKTILPVLLSIFLLILAHHLSVLYFVATLLGFCISCWFFKPERFKNGTLMFFVLAIFTYTAWFVYGTLFYPSFFNVYVYFSGFSNPTQQSASAGLLNNITFFLYPAFIVTLFLVEFQKTVRIGNPLIFVRNLRLKIGEIRILGSNNSILFFTMGFVIVALLFILGIGVPVLFGTRILEILCIGMYPFASQTLINLTESKSKKKKFLIYLIILIVIFVSIYRYYTQIQRRVVL